MVTSPQLVQRTAQPYMAIRRQVSMDGFGPVIDESFPQVFAWLREHALGPAGPPLIRYLFINMPTKLDVEIGVPVATEPRCSNGAPNRRSCGTNGRPTMARSGAPASSRT